MLPLGPFEDRPHMAVAVSGGVDSTALAVLLADWVGARGGRLSILSVDHGLRAESAAECRQVGLFAAQLGRQAGMPPIDHHILVWDGPKPASGLMAAARDARYRLLADWCRTQSVLHLVVAHQADDQVETYLMRQAHGSSDYGLAAMPALRMLDGVRLLRPLLPVAKARLTATLRSRGQAWIEDPSNSATRFERVRWRARPGAGDDLPAVSAAAARAGSRRDASERMTAAWLARYGRIAPAGYIRLDCAAFKTISPDTAAAILRNSLHVIGAESFGPSPAALTAAVQRIRLREAGGMTLAGCMLDWRSQRLLICRESASCAGPLAMKAGEVARWDGRYRVKLIGAPGNKKANLAANSTLSVAALGEWGLANRPVPEDLASLPLPARQALPGLWQAGRLTDWPDVSCPTWGGSRRDDRPGRVSHGSTTLDVAFLPRLAATSCGFTVVMPAKHTM
ncbi:MAG: tRNA lysidine(34) synthetase TilS [Dongiaceae bacterium]